MSWQNPELYSTAWGGDSEFVEISAKFNQNLDALLETVLLVAEIQELKADTDGSCYRYGY